MNGIFQDILATIAEQHLLFRNTIYLTETYRENTLLTLVINAGIEAQLHWIEILYRIQYLLRR